MNKQIKIIAAKWFNGTYDEQLARMRSTIKNVDFNAVAAEYNRMRGLSK